MTAADEEFAPILTGRGASDYERYLRTDELLSLQKSADEWVHRDELLFQTVHQSSELWLNLAAKEVEDATALVETRDLYQLAEHLTEWDERVGVWRFRHFKVVARIIGEDVVGTQGTPVELLAGLIKNKLFPDLWNIRTRLTELANQSD